MKHLVPIHVANYVGSPGSVQPGFKKFYLKNGYFKLYDGANENDLVLDRPLDGFVPIPGIITSADSVLTAIEKLDFAISSINPTVNWGSITGNILAQTDLIAYIAAQPANTLQQVVNAGNGISNFGGIGNASIQSTNFTNNRTLYLNDSAFPTIRIVDNLNASNNLQIDLDTLTIDGVSYNWSTIVNPPASPLSALPFTTDHLTATNNQYVIGDLVWYLGNVYRCIANNDSIIPTSTLYWTNLGAGYPLVQQPVDWNSTSGNNQILNKPTIPTLTSQLTNDSGFLTQESVLEFPNFSSFPVIGAANTIYIAVDTDLAYYWDGVSYQIVTTSVSGITGFGILNRIAKFTPNGSAIGSSKIYEDPSGKVAINWFARPLINGNTIMSIQRTQAQIDFVLGNPGFSQPAIMISDNQIDGFEIHSKGELAFKTGATYSNEGLRIFASGQLKLTQTPATGATTDFVLLRDTSGNLKQIAYPTIPPGFTSPLTTKGDIFVRNTTVDARLPVGLDTQILIADSSTPTGLKWGSNTAATPTGYYAMYQDVLTQTVAVINTGYPIKFRTLDFSNGVTVVSDSRITFANTGIYNLQFSVQLQNSDTQEHDVTIWLRKNGVDVVGSAGFVAVVSKHGGINGHVLPSWNYLLDVVAGEYYELVWSATSTQVTMPFIAAGSPPPSTASAIFTVTQQSGIMAGTGMTALTTTGTSGPATYNSGTGILNVPQYSGGSIKSINSVSTNTSAGSAASTDYIYLASGTINITLPTAVGNNNYYTIKNVGTGVITINTTSSQTIDGSLTAPIRVQYLSLTLISDGANWNII
jgi:hypothetical protein